MAFWQGNSMSISLAFDFSFHSVAALASLTFHPDMWNIGQP